MGGNQAPLRLWDSWKWKGWLLICECTIHFLWFDLTSTCLTLSSQATIYLSGSATNTSMTL